MPPRKSMALGGVMVPNGDASMLSDTDQTVNQRSQPVPATILNQSSAQVMTNSTSNKQTTVVEIRSPKAVAVMGGSGAEKKERKSTGAQNGGTGNGGGATGLANSTTVQKEKDKDGKEKKRAKEREEPTIDDLLLPRTLISRLARGSLPPNTSLQKDALLALTKSASVFVSYLTHTANMLTSRKHIQVEDVLKAISEMELDSVMRDRLEKEIELFEEGVRDKRKVYKDRIKARESGISQMENDDNEDQPADHVHKKLKRNIGYGDSDADVDMGGINRTTSTRIEPTSRREVSNDGDGEDDDDPSAQLLFEASQAADLEVDEESESDQDIVDDEVEGEEDGIIENEDDEDEDDDDDDNDDEASGEENGRQGKGRRKLADNEDDDMDQSRRGRKYLAPDGRAELGGSDEDDSD